jgi:protein-disulfide isomerase
VKLVFRDYPIDNLHPAARKAHEAARCAHAQGKFWAYHDLLFNGRLISGAQPLESFVRVIEEELARAQ